MNDRAVHAHRVIFIDLARALAVVLMVAGHTSSALLASGTEADLVRRLGVSARAHVGALSAARGVCLQRGDDAPLGVAHLRVRRRREAPPPLRAVRPARLRAAFPGAALLRARGATESQWRSFLAVDVLQLIGVTFVAVQLLVLVSRTRRAFMVVGVRRWHRARRCGARGVADRLDASAAAARRVSVAGTGSLFPLFPWAGFVLVGAGAGQMYARWGAANLGAFANWGMLGAWRRALIVAGLTRWSGDDSRSDVCMRTGVCLLILGLVAHVSRHVAQLPHVFGAVAQESLVVYFVHLCIVYGSIWNPGLARFYGGALDPRATAPCCPGGRPPMIALAWQWNGLKHLRPRAARWVSLAAGSVLIGLLI